MKKLQIVMDIDEGDLWDIQRFGPRYGLTRDDRVIRAVQNGIPLDQHKEVKKLQKKVEQLKQRLNSAYGSLDFANYKDGDFSDGR